MKPYKAGDKVRSKTNPHKTGIVKWVRHEPNGVFVNRQSSGGKWKYVEKIPKGGYTVSIIWDAIPQTTYYPERPLHGLQNSTTIELIPQEVSNPQQTTTKEVAVMKECKHEIWSWKVIPDQVNTNYQAVYCDLCDEQLAHVGSPNKTVTETAKPQPKEKTMKDKLKGKFVIAGTGSRELVLDVEKRRKVRDYLVDLLTQAKAKHGENLVVISGMAEGFDEALARAAIQADVPFIAAIPNPGYIDYYWGKKHSLLKVDRIESANEVLSHALEVINVCPTLYGVTHNFMGGANFDRNEWMGDHADVVWVYNPTTKGTAQMYKYCKTKKIKTFIINTEKEGK